MIRIAPLPASPIRTVPWILGATLALLVAGLLLGLRPLKQEAARLEASLEAAGQRVAAHQGRGRPSLVTRLQAEQAAHRQLQAEWERQQERIRAFRQPPVPTEPASLSAEGRIDFKVALFEARQRLGRLAEERDVTLPPDLGIPDTIGADEDTETRLGQLAATVRLLETCIAHGVPVIERVRALPPETIRLTESGGQALQFYPVEMQVRCPYPALLDLLDSLDQRPPQYALYRFQVTSPFPEQTDLLQARLDWAVIMLAPVPRGEEPPPEPVAPVRRLNADQEPDR